MTENSILSIKGDISDLKEGLSKVERGMDNILSCLQGVPGTLQLTNPTTVSTFSTGANSDATNENLTKAHRWLFGDETGTKNDMVERTLVAVEDLIKQ